MTRTAWPQAGQEELGTSNVSAFITSTWDPGTRLLADTRAGPEHRSAGQADLRQAALRDSVTKEALVIGVFRILFIRSRSVINPDLGTSAQCRRYLESRSGCLRCKRRGCLYACPRGWRITWTVSSPQSPRKSSLR